ncbi:MAG: fhcB [Planctomycetaceae bacterium]|nr:fhcB [Planctomycetaceae bacterium]
MGVAETQGATLTTVADVTCPVCGCTCDDLKLTLDGDRVVSTERACGLAEPWFRDQSAARPAIAELDGHSALLKDALDRAAEILAGADAPLVYGLSRSSTPGQRAAVLLADHLGAVVDTTASICHGPSIMAVQKVGESTCTLGEIRNRADLVIFWGCNPAVTHPRHAERYSVFATGRWTPQGRADRKVIMVGDQRYVRNWRLDADGALPDQFISIHPKRDFEVLTALRSLLAGKPLANAERMSETLGVSVDVLADLAQQMKSCRCGIVFFGLGLTETKLDAITETSGQGHLNVENLLKLVAELNAFTRFHARRMRIQGDVTGADSVMCWQTGYPFSVSMSRGYPRYNPGEFSANEVLERGEADVCLLVGTETVSFFSPAARQHLESIPTIVLDYPATVTERLPTVKFTTAVYGLHAPGTIYRMDEVPIGLRPGLKTAYPTDETILRELLTRIAPRAVRASDFD